MSKRRRAPSRFREPRPVAPRAGTASLPAATLRAPAVDLRELATGAFVVSMLLIGSQLWPRLFSEASDLLLGQLMFEFPMALLAVCAGQAVRHPSRAVRVACVLLGLFGVALAGSVNALQLDAPWAIAGGLWLLAARAAPPRGIDWFSSEHCRAIEVTAGTAWACLVGALLLLMLGQAMTPAQADSDALPSFVYAIVWGAYYLSLGLLLPRVRQRFIRPQRR